MKFLGSVIIFSSLLLAAGPSWGQDAVDLDRLPDPVPDAPAAAKAVRFTVYGDLSLLVDWDKPELDRITTASFAQNHRSLLVEAGYADEASMMTDVFNPTSLFYFTVQGQAGSLSFGMLPVPFGEFNFHHIYGGFEDERGDFLPKLWSDLGVAARWQPLAGVTLEPYVVSGFSTRAGGSEPNFQSTGADHEQAAKALGLRAQWAPSPGAYVTVSLFDQEFDQRVFRGRNLLLSGLDAAYRWGPLTLKAGGVSGWVRNEQTQFHRWASYGEGSWTLAPGWSLRLRGGQMDPDDRAPGPEDQADLNAGVLWKGEVLEVDTVFFHHWSTSAAFQGANGFLSDTLMVKVLMSL